MGNIADSYLNSDDFRILRLAVAQYGEFNILGSVVKNPDFFLRSLVNYSCWIDLKYI